MTGNRDFTELAHRVADAAGAILRRHFRAGVAVEQKADQSPVTVADREAEAAIRAILVECAPTHGVIGEELGSTQAGAELVWVIDPIDGTKAFITGKPMFATLVALLRAGRPILGLIDQPIVGDRWFGTEGQPTLFNGRQVRTRPCVELRQARLSTTGPQYFTPAKKQAFDAVAARAELVSYGGDGYQYGLAASGHVDLVVESGLKLHDFAALVPIVTGAGGLFTDWQGRPVDATSAGDVIAAGDARTHAEALELLRSA